MENLCPNVHPSDPLRLPPPEARPSLYWARAVLCTYRGIEIKCYLGREGPPGETRLVTIGSEIFTLPTPLRTPLWRAFWTDFGVAPHSNYSGLLRLITIWTVRGPRKGPDHRHLGPKFTLQTLPRTTPQGPARACIGVAPYYIHVGVLESSAIGAVRAPLEGSTFGHSRVGSAFRVFFSGFRPPVAKFDLWEFPREKSPPCSKVRSPERR